MKAIIGNVTELKDILNKYIGKVTFIDIDVPKEDFKVIQYTRLDKGKVFNFTLTLYNKEIGTNEIVIQGCNKLPLELKEFLETNEFITFGMIFDLKVMLTYGVKINIVEDMRMMLHFVLKEQGKASDFSKKSMRELLNVFYSESYVKHFLDKLNHVEVIEKLYIRFKKNCDNLYYRALLKETRLVAYNSYFGISTDIDTEKVTKYTEEKLREIESIRETCLLTYGFDITNNFELRSYIGRILNKEYFEIRMSSAAVKYIDQHYPEHRDFVSLFRRYKQLNRDKNYLSRTFLSTLRIRDDYALAPSSRIMDYISNNCLDIFSVDSRKYYYMAIDCNLPMVQKYLEKVCNNVIIQDDADYHKYTASLVYGKPIEEVTWDERRKAKMYNFYRFYTSEPIYSRFINKTMILEQIKDIPYKERAPLFKTNWLKGYNELMLLKLAALQDLLASFGDNSIIFSAKEFDCLLFKVSNKINPYRAMKWVSDALDTTSEIGIRLFSIFSVGRDLKELDTLMHSRTEFGNYIPNITYDGMLGKYNNITKEKLPCVVDMVKKDFGLV